MEPQIEQMPQGAPEDAGRGTDTVMAHMSLGEVVIPRSFLDDPQVMEMLQALFEQGGANLAEFTVGDPANKINPETGYPEFGFFKSLKKIASIALPVAAAYFAPGIGSALGSTLGASSLGAIGGAGGGALGGLIGGKGLGGALKGAALGGAGGYLANGGFGETFGNLADAPLASGVQGPVRSGSGILGSLSSATGITNNSIPSLGGILGGTSGGGSSSFGSALGGSLASSLLGGAASAAGGISQDAAIKKQKDALLEANQQQLANLNTFDPSGITSDPGYEFRKAEGQKALDTGLSAQGGLFSGRALKEATQYNQDYANNAFNDYYERWKAKTNAQNSLYGTTGDIRANAAGANSQNLSQSLSNALGARVGNYGNTGGLTLAQLKALGLA